jgi:hypothetical protein
MKVIDSVSTAHRSSSGQWVLVNHIEPRNASMWSFPDVSIGQERRWGNYYYPEEECTVCQSYTRAVISYQADSVYAAWQESTEAPRWGWVMPSLPSDARLESGWGVSLIFALTSGPPTGWHPLALIQDTYMLGMSVDASFATIHFYRLGDKHEGVVMQVHKRLFAGWYNLISVSIKEHELCVFLNGLEFRACAAGTGDAPRDEAGPDFLRLFSSHRHAHHGVIRPAAGCKRCGLVDVRVAPEWSAEKHLALHSHMVDSKLWKSMSGVAEMMPTTNATLVPRSARRVVVENGAEIAAAGTQVVVTHSPSGPRGIRYAGLSAEYEEQWTVTVKLVGSSDNATCQALQGDMIHRQRVAVLPFRCSSATGSINVEHTSGAVVVAPTQKPLWLMLHVPSGTLLHVQAMDVPFVDIIAAGANVAVQDPTAPGSLILVSMHGYEAAQTRTLYFANSTHDLIPVQSITRTEGNIQVLAGLPSDSITAVWEGALPGAHANCSTIASVNCTAGRIHVAEQSASRRGSFVFTVESDGSITSSQVDTLDGKSAAVAVVGSGDGVMAVHTLHDVVTVSLAEYTGQWSWAKARFNCTGGTVGVRRVWSKENTLVLALDASCPRPWLESALRWNSVATSSRSSAADVLLIALDLTAPTNDANPLVLTSAWVPASAVDAMDIAIAPRAVHVHLANTEAHHHGPEFGGQVTPAFKVPGEAGGVLLKWNAFQEDDFTCTGGAGVEQLATVRPTTHGAVAVSQADEDVWPLWTMTELVPTPSWQWEATAEFSCCAASAVDTTIVTVDGMERAMSLLNATCECDGSITWLASQGISSMELPRAGEIMMLVEFDVVSGALL